MKGTDSQVKFANFLRRMHICWIGCSTNHSTLFIILKVHVRWFFFLVYYINNVFNKHS